MLVPPANASPLANVSPLSMWVPSITIIFVDFVRSSPYLSYFALIYVNFCPPAKISPLPPSPLYPLPFLFYRKFHGFGQAKSPNSGLVLGSGQFLILP